MTTIQLTNYAIDKQLDQDDWITTYQGKRISDDQPVLIKMVASSLLTDELLMQRFKYITGRIAKLSHPNIVPSYEAIEEQGCLYVIHDFFVGRSLFELIETEGAFSISRMQAIVGQLASALDYAHHQSVTHGELSAHNVYLDSEDRVMVTGFSYSQMLFGGDLANQSHTIRYPELFSPERARGQGPTRHADLYSLGVLCYQMLAKEPPFTGPCSAVLHAHMYKQPRPIHLINPGVPIPLSETLNRMLSKSVDLRYNTAAEFAYALGVTATSKNFFQYGKQLPIYNMEHHRQLIDRSFVYFCISLTFMLMIMGVSSWAGYEVGIKYTANQIRQVVVEITATTMTATPMLPATSESQAWAVKPIPVQPTYTTISDTLPTFASPTLIPPTATPMDSVVMVAVASATPLPVAQSSDCDDKDCATDFSTPTLLVNQGTFSFHNPTGYDLVIDLTGPIYLSEVVLPYSQHDFSLEAGAYQYIVHTTTGKELPTKVGNFDLLDNQVIERDYYSPHDVVLE
jgi:serine/threonine-protein kinase